MTTPSDAAAETMFRFDLPSIDSLPDDIAETINSVQERSGFVPNVFLALARRPAEFRAFMAYHDALMDSNDGLSKAEREMIVVATSAMNGCVYCVVAHGAILRVRSKNSTIADQLAINPLKATLSEREQHIVDFALDVAVDSDGIDDERLDEMRAVGFSDDEIWDIGSIASFFAMSNRFANFTGLMPNNDFYTIGRDQPAGGAG